MTRSDFRKMIIVLWLVGFVGFSAAQTPILSLARDANLEEIRAAIQAGADVNTSDEYGQTVLMYAAGANEDPEVMTLLVTSGADINAISLASWTALMYAARDNTNPEVVLRLLELGADPKKVNSENRNALYYARDNANLVGTPAYERLEQLTNYVPPSTIRQSPPSNPPATTRNCCRYCRKGKACGNSCINRSYTCHRGQGCACNATIGTPDYLIADEEHFFDLASATQTDFTYDWFNDIVGTSCEPGAIASLTAQ